MQDRDYGWTAEMQSKAARDGVRAIEVPVSYKKRIGVSKITGTVKGTVLAGWKILSTVFIVRFLGGASPGPARQPLSEPCVRPRS